MKKILATFATLVTMASTANADFARVELGVGAWDQEPTGTMSYTENLNFGAISGNGKGLYTSSQTKETNAYAWMLVKHPIPIIPNIRLEYSEANDKGEVTGRFEDFVAPVGSAATMSLRQVDVIPYYNLLDNTFWMTVDLGLDLKVIEADYTAQGVTVGITQNTNYNSTESIVLPLAYLRLRVEIPVTNIGVETDAKYVTYAGSTLYDVRAKIDYTLDFVPVVQPALEVGYRIQKFDLTSDDDKTKTNLEFSGIYAGLMLRF